MPRMLSFLMLVIALTFGVQEVHAARIGVAAVVKNTVSGSTGGQTRVINVGAGVFQNEVITTGAASSAQLLFRDETSLTIGASARLTLDRFVYNPSRKTGDIVVNVVQGAFRFVSGSAGPGSYKIKTRVASIGLRGTIVEGYVSPGGGLLLVIVEGSVIVRTANGTTITLGAGQYVTISSTGVVTGPLPWTGRTLDIDSGHEFILDTDNPLGEQHGKLNDALDSRNVDINYPDTPSPVIAPPTVIVTPPVKAPPPVRGLSDTFNGPSLSIGNGNYNVKQSDMRLKRDIQYLATLENGIKVYSFRYLWEETVRVGVMAQDLLRDPAHAHAVLRARNGFYAVEYGALGLRMTTLAEWRRRGHTSVHDLGRIGSVSEQNR